MDKASFMSTVATAKADHTINEKSNYAKSNNQKGDNRRGNNSGKRKRNGSKGNQKSIRKPNLLEIATTAKNLTI